MAIIIRSSTIVFARPISTLSRKKPFFHFLPGTEAFSIATAGCNMNCKFCQNWSISQFRPEDVKHHDMTAAELVKIASKNKCRSVAYTYSEPTIFYEYMYDCAVEAGKLDIRSAVVSAGYIEKQPLLDLLPLVDAIKIDLKAFTESYYEEVVNGQLRPVLNTLTTIAEKGMWLEIVYLMLPGLNDSAGEITKMCKWIVANLGPDVPVHFTRFHPSYLMQNLPVTPLDSLEQAHSIASAEGVHYPYIGNVYGHEAESTYCHSCGELLIGRKGYQITANKLNQGKCPACKNRDTRHMGLSRHAIYLGLLSISYQVIYARMAIGFAGGNEIYLSIFFLLWFVFTASGAILIKSIKPVPMFIMLGFLSSILPAFFYLATRISGTLPGQIISPTTYLITLVVVLMPVCLINGGLFASIADEMKGEGRSARVYYNEAFGALLAGIATTGYYLLGGNDYSLLLGLSVFCILFIPAKKKLFKFGVLILFHLIFIMNIGATLESQLLKNTLSTVRLSGIGYREVGTLRLCKKQ